MDFGLFWPFFNQKTDKNEENWQNPNRLMKFSEIWYLDTSQQKKCYIKTIFRFRHFLGKKTAKIDQNEENWQNLNRMVKSSEIWYIDASQQKKIQQKN